MKHSTVEPQSVYKSFLRVERFMFFNLRGLLFKDVIVRADK